MAGDLVERLRGLRVHIEALGVGCCTCGTKSPDAHWHAVECKVHNLAHALDNLDAVRDEATRLRSENAELVEALNECAPWIEDVASPGGGTLFELLGRIRAILSRVSGGGK